MWEFKTELKDELLDGRTMSSIAKKIGITRQGIECIMKAKNTTRKTTAYCIVKCCNPDAEVEDYFVRKEK